MGAGESEFDSRDPDLMRVGTWSNGMTLVLQTGSKSSILFVSTIVPLPWPRGRGASFLNSSTRVRILPAAFQRARVAQGRATPAVRVLCEFKSRRGLQDRGLRIEDRGLRIEDRGWRIADRKLGIEDRQPSSELDTQSSIFDSQFSIFDSRTTVGKLIWKSAGVKLQRK